MFITEGRENYWMLNWLDEFMAHHKGFICGGCFKNIFNKEKVKDLDIFFKCQEDFDEAVAYFDGMTAGGWIDGDPDNIMVDEHAKYTFLYENKNVKAYVHKRTGVRIELCNKIFGTPEEILSQFDFTVVKFAYYKAEVADDDPFENLPGGNISTHIEYRVMMHDKFFEHLHTHRLVTDDKIPFPMSTLERAFRYAKYGYAPCRETKMKIAKAIWGLPEAGIEVSESLYDGMD